MLGLNGTADLPNPEDDVRMRDDYSRIREVKFLGAIGPLGERRLCKIKCIGGQWVGPLCINQQGNTLNISFNYKVEIVPKTNTRVINLER